MKFKTPIIIIIILLSIGLLGYFTYASFSNRNNPDQVGVKKTELNADKLVVSSQDGKGSVSINEANLSQPGFVVVRGSDGKHLGQIIEMSEYLGLGENKNIKISLGDFYTYNEADQLLVMIYRDSNGDKMFSELDEPAIDSNGNMIATFAKTGKPVPVSVLQQEVAPTNGTGMETVKYTNNGFQPSKLTVPLGTMVEFINQSDKEMWVASNMHPSHEILPTFDQFKGVRKGESYMYVFDKKGGWTYHDHLKPSFEGIITVQ